MESSSSTCDLAVAGEDAPLAALDLKELGVSGDVWILRLAWSPHVTPFTRKKPGAPRVFQRPDVWTPLCPAVSGRGVPSPGSMW